MNIKLNEAERHCKLLRKESLLHHLSDQMQQLLQFGYGSVSIAARHFLGDAAVALLWRSKEVFCGGIGDRTLLQCTPNASAVSYSITKL